MLWRPAKPRKFLQALPAELMISVMDAVLEQLLLSQHDERRRTANERFPMKNRCRGIDEITAWGVFRCGAAGFASKTQVVPEQRQVVIEMACRATNRSNTQPL
jgi:hypothetical protein